MQPHEALEIILEILKRAPVSRAEAYAAQKAVPVLIAATAPQKIRPD
jgi:hypothetical protein